MRIFAGVFVGCAIVLSFTGFGNSSPPPIAATFHSTEALAAAVLESFDRRDAGALGRLALSKDEFSAHVWPELPVSRPERNMPIDYVWGDLEAKSRGHLAANLRCPLPVSPRLVRVLFDGETTQHESFTILRDSRMIIADGNGEETTVRLFGSVLEKNGRYKVFSFVTD